MDHTKKHLTRLVGSMIIGVEVDDPELPAHRRMYGLHVKTPGGEHLIAWSWRDPEGNGPGFIDIEDVAEDARPIETSDGPKFAVGNRVAAKQTITEGGKGYFGDLGPAIKGKPSFAPNYVHALPGEIGIVIGVDEDWFPTVRFERTGTATLVHPAEIELTAFQPEEDQSIDVRLTEKGRQALETAAKPMWCCAECGSLDVQGKFWVRLRDKQLVDEIEDNDYWCPQCEEHVRVKLRDA